MTELGLTSLANQLSSAWPPRTNLACTAMQAPARERLSVSSTQCMRKYKPCVASPHTRLETKFPIQRTAMYDTWIGGLLYQVCCGVHADSGYAEDTLSAAESYIGFHILSRATKPLSLRDFGLPRAVIRTGHPFDMRRLSSPLPIVSGSLLRCLCGSKAACIVAECPQTPGLGSLCTAGAAPTPEDRCVGVSEAC
ncbi:hypothetical protein BDZ85DRAFT_259065 [Elsinoe ampelina]|uniref:Uncharacterized protein n=1 Tax=Elsinoe ampelina TaxID=302913 RepID=A0A6A6GGP5_9PEZI|nr:hypothetical protein BDZ85DRAFT_259065 [Elsinoe ampelina]